MVQTWLFYFADAFFRDFAAVPEVFFVLVVFLTFNDFFVGFVVCLNDAGVCAGPGSLV